MRAVLLLLFVALSVTEARSQSDTIAVSGYVRYADEPVEACVVSMLNPKDSVIVAYTTTDARGFYAMKRVTKLREVLISVNGFNVKKQVKRIDATTERLDFTVQEENITLREVQVKARKLWGNRDTLNYLVSAYTREHDRTIGDVLKQLPGISVEDNGLIKYLGTPINHFYIENLDMLQGRYTLATQGIKAEDVASVQVLENHEHVKALQDQIPPESAAINLKLKNKAKGVWSKSADLGVGAYGDGALWDVTLQAMYFNKNAQHLLRYGGDNIGKGLDASVSHYGLSASSGACLTDILRHGSSPVGNSLFGYRHAVNLNNLAKLSEDVTLKYNLNYNHNHSYGSSFSGITYILPDGSTRLLTEEISDRVNSDAADLQLTYEKNAERKFLNNTLSLSGKWNEGRGTVISDGEIDQASHYRSLSLANRTRLVHRTEHGGGFEWTSTNSLVSTPQALAVEGETNARQDAEITEVSTINSFESLRNITARKWTLSASGQVDATYTTLSSILTYPNVRSNNIGDMSHLKALVGAGPAAKYANRSVQASLSVPVVLTYTNLTNSPMETEETNAKRTRLRLQPRLSLLWKASSYFTVDASARYATEETPWQQLLTTYIICNYRSMSRYRATLADSHSGDGRIKVSYKDIFNSLFAYLEGGWNRTWSDIVYDTTIDDQAHSVIEAYAAPNRSRNFSLTAYGCKDFDWHTLRLELNASTSQGNAELSRQSVLTEYRTAAYVLGGSLALDIVQGYRLYYNVRRSRHTYETDEYRHDYHDLTQQAKLDLRLVPSRLLFNISANHTYNSSLASLRKNYVFVGAGLRYILSKTLELDLDGDNLTNIHTYATYTAGDMERRYARYALRPWSVTLSLRVKL